MFPEIKTTLYHGTVSEITSVDVNAGRSRKDFGKGFYMAVTKKQAIGMMHKKYREAVRRSANKNTTAFREYLYEVELDPQILGNLNIKIFQNADIEWLDFILMCRYKGGMPHDYDMVIGATADDDTALCLKVYEEGAYGEKGSIQAKQILLQNLEVENLGIQYYIGKQKVADAVIKSIREIDWR
ncbi:MAG: DUF3990 domain-containing protein [Clostridiales bacterium]|nr:DUF3990 domain-containing protein [Clostridiales bacterium]